MYRFIFSIFCLLSITNSVAQFPPQVGNVGTTAIHRDSSIISNWALSCNLKRGWQNIADTTLGKSIVGDETYVPGPAGNGIVSLGDGGEATVTFLYPIKNGNGFDFVVFENGFIDQSLDTGTAFLELAFVEVSSDGIQFFRFPATSLVDTSSQLGSFAGMRADKISNLAGKFIMPYGTPFDLEELKDIVALNVNAITHIRIVDVVGSLQNNYASRDQFGNKINDPWPTPFASSGFDLDAIGVIHQNTLLSTKDLYNSSHQIILGANPANRFEEIKINATISGYLSVINQLGQVVYHSTTPEHSFSFYVEHTGAYTAIIDTEVGMIYKRFVVK